ncbi:MAG: ATP-binding protein [Chloroflexi bacterium]|nr:ATP-binding protein [Chloroflexota bacterium]MBU1747049.1 ATP-binding protein [Chloroflexota bacterium]
METARPGDFEAFNSAEFADREKELSLLEDALAASRAGPIPKPLIEFYGVVGQGKTWLIHRLHREFCRASPGNVDQARPSISVLVDLRDFPSPEDQTRLLRALADQLRDQLIDPDVQEWHEEATQLAIKGEGKSGMQRLARLLSATTERYVPVLFFDTAEQVSEPMLDWVERYLIDPLVRTERAIVVFAGRRWLRWKIFEVRRHALVAELGPFDDEGLREQAQRLGASTGTVANLVPLLREYAFGHPLTGKAILNQVREQIAGHQPIDEWLAPWQDEICDTVAHAVIQARFLIELRVRNLDYLEPILPVIYILRKFNPTPLRVFTERLLDPDIRDKKERYAPRPGSFYLDAIRDLQIATLAEWSSAQGGYVLAPIIRKIMAQNLRMQDPTRFLHYHQRARVVYDEWITAYPRNAVGFLIERTYHRTWELVAQTSLNGQAASKVVAEFHKLWDEVQKHKQVEWDLPDMAVALVEKLDEDNELRDLIPDPGYSQLQAIATQTLEQLRAMS